MKTLLTSRIVSSVFAFAPAFANTLYQFPDSALWQDSTVLASPGNIVFIQSNFTSDFSSLELSIQQDSLLHIAGERILECFLVHSFKVTLTKVKHNQ